MTSHRRRWPRATFLALLTLAALPLAMGRGSAASPPRAERTLLLDTALQRSDGRPEIVWVYFRDKGDAASRLAEARAALTPRALARRALRGEVAAVTLEDVPLVRAYVDEVARRVVRVRQEVPWVNAVSVEATTEQVDALAALPFVARLDLVRRYRARRDDEEGQIRGASAAGPAQADDLPWKQRLPNGSTPDYGPSQGQLQQIDVPAVHAQGLHGEGVVIAMLDAGFNTLSHEAFASLQIADHHDFVNGDEDVGDGSDKGEGSHGTETLSVIGGFRSGRLVGPAFAATFLLAKTENTDSETPVEEDNWAAAAEWAEARGADVISSSLGYTTFDPPFPSYTPQDMNGRTAISTKAAELAAARGVVVVNSAGNDGLNTQHNTLGAPSDGPHVIAVAAVDQAGRRATFSSVGPSADGRIKPDVAAQGVTVITAQPHTASGYAGLNGTSFSCPLTAGVAALVLQARPGASVDAVADALRNTASQSSRPDNLLGWGIVDAAAAVRAIRR